MGYRFEWDREKNNKNVFRRGISFDEAKSVFFDPDYMEKFNQEKDGEDRFVAIGFSNKGRVLLVVHTYRGFGRIIRIVSAWKASKEQIAEYFKQR